MICPLCKTDSSSKYSSDKTRDYFLCGLCYLVFVDREALISIPDEKKRYDLHDNLEADSGYGIYLKKIADSILPHLQDGQRGLDFGSGKTKRLAELLSPHEVESYDIFYHNDQTLLQRSYDFIILSEVIEHLREPMETMVSLNEILNPSGSFFIKTKLRPETEERFSNWFYKRDITHIEFFSLKSLGFLGDRLGRKNLKQVGEDLFRISDH